MNAKLHSPSSPRPDCPSFPYNRADGKPNELALFVIRSAAMALAVFASMWLWPGRMAIAQTQLPTSYAYSECKADGFWYVVTQSLVQGPKGYSVEKTQEVKTDQRCDPKAIPPAPNNSVVEKHYYFRDGMTGACGGSQVIGYVVRDVCEKVWVRKIFEIRECPDHTTFVDSQSGKLIEDSTVECPKNKPPFTPYPAAAKTGLEGEGSQGETPKAEAPKGEAPKGGD